MAALVPPTTALIVIDVQKGFDEIELAGHARNNPDALARIAELIAAFRDANGMVIHIRHASREQDSPFRPDRPGYAVKEEARERAGEPIVVKHVNSAFIGTDLEARLRAAAVTALVIVGATTNHCVETTARMASNLGFEIKLVRDAAWTFDRVGPDGDHHRAAELHQMTLANLHGEFAEIVEAREVIRRLRSARRLVQAG